MLKLFSQGKAVKSAAETLYQDVVTRARQPVFFVNFAVPDTLDGRFDILTLHAWLVLHALAQNPAQERLSQAFIDRLFIGFDEAYRELGAGDIGMGRRMKKLASAFYGRLTAYDAATDQEGFAAALVRNLYRGAENTCAAALANYLLAVKQIVTVTAEGRADFGPLPRGEEDIP